MCGCDSCQRVDMQMQMKRRGKRMKKMNLLCTNVLHADANECKKKRRKKKELTWNGGMQM